MTGTNDDAPRNSNERQDEAGSSSVIADDQLRVILGSAAEAYFRARDSAEELIGPLQERMKNLDVGAGVDARIGRLSKELADQHSSIEELVHAEVSMPELPDLSQLENPRVKTNEKLDLVLLRFAQMQEIAANAARIATQTQEVALEFVHRFERAAQDNDRAARRAIWIGGIAVGIAVLMPSAQIIYSELRREPSSQPAMATAIENVRAEIRFLRESQAAVSDRLTDALASSDEKTAAILREIRQLLSEDKDGGIAELPPAQQQ